MKFKCSLLAYVAEVTGLNYDWFTVHFTFWENFVPIWNVTVLLFWQRYQDIPPSVRGSFFSLSTWHNLLCRVILFKSTTKCKCNERENGRTAVRTVDKESYNVKEQYSAKSSKHPQWLMLKDWFISHQSISTEPL